MDYEKAYKDALERAKSAIKECGDNKGRITMIESIFPELKESEDERMLRNFKSYLQEEIESYTYDCRDEEDRQKLKMFKYILAWLEKQGKPISRFKVGDKVLWKYDKSVVRTITNVSDCGTYWIECKGCSSGWWSEQELEPCVNKDEQKPTQSPMTKLEEKLSSLVVAAVHTYCEKNLLDTPHFVGLILGDNMAKEWSKEILTLAEEELRKIKAMEWKDEQHAQEKQQLIDEACKWLAKNDSYAIPTNLQVDRLREHLNNIK